MATLENLVRFESAHSGLAFRESLYGPDEDAQLLIDSIALANAESTGRRFLFFGVDTNGECRRIVGTDKQSLRQFKQRFARLVAEFVEPALNAAVRCVEVDGQLVGYIRIKECSSAPYLIRQSMNDALQAGVGYIRRGTTNYPMQRSDMQRMFRENAATAESAPAVRIGFPGREPAENLTLPVLPLNKLPSQLAEERIRSLLAAREQAREVFGRTETQFSRLMHARLYGVDVPFEKRSDESLVGMLDSVETEFGAADDHYIYEVRAHKVNLQIVNDGDSNLHNALLRLTLPQTEGTGIVERICSEDVTELQPEGYPAVERGSRTVSLISELDTLYAGRSVKAFREPVRFWAREPAAGKAVPIDYELSAEELAAPIKGSLVIYVDKATLKSV